MLSARLGARPDPCQLHVTGHPNTSPHFSGHPNTSPTSPATRSLHRTSSCNITITRKLAQHPRRYQSFGSSKSIPYIEQRDHTPAAERNHPRIRPASYCSLLLLSSTLPFTAFTSPLPRPSSSLSGKFTPPRTHWPLSPGPLAPARAPDSPHTHPALLGPRSRLPPARLHTTPRTWTLYTTLPKCFTPRPGLARPLVTAITLYTTARPSISPRHGDHVHTTHVPSVRAGPLGYTRLGWPGP